MLAAVIKLLAICLLSTRICVLADANGWKNGGNVGEFLTQKLEMVEQASNKVSLREIHLETPSLISFNNTKAEAVKVFRTVDSVYFLKGRELLTVEVEGQVQLRTIAILELPQEEIVEMRVGDWEGMLVVVLRFPTNLHVYVTKKEQTTLASLEPVQKIKISSPGDRIVLLNSNNELNELFLVTQIAKNNIAELSCYKWETSFFSRKSLDMIDFPSKNILFGIDEVSNGPLMLSVGYGNTTQVIIYQLEAQTGQLTKLQSLYFKQSYAEHYVYNRRLFLIACSTESFCAVYKWNGGQFRRHFKISMQVLEKISRIEYHQDFLILHSRFHHSLQLYAKEDIVHSEQGLLVQKSSEKSEYVICKSKSLTNRDSYFVEFAVKDSILTISSRKIVLIEILTETQNEKMDVKVCSRQLKLNLKQRIPQVQAAHQLVLNLAAQPVASIDKSSKRMIRAASANLVESNVQHITMPFVVESTVFSLRDRIAAAEVMIARGRTAIKSSQNRASLNRENDEPVTELKNIIVKNLEQSSAENLLKGVQLKSQPQLTFSEQKKFRNATAVKVVLEEGIINGIPINTLLNATSTKVLPGEKVFEKLEANTVVSALTLNNVDVSLLESAIKSWETLPSKFIFKGQVKLKNLHLDTMNGIPLNSLFENVFLNKERTHIRGNCFFNDATSTRSLTTNQLGDFRVSDALTTATDQTVAADCSLAKFYTLKLATRLLNNEKLNETVALADGINLVEVPTRIISVHVLRNLNILEEDEIVASRTIETLRNHIIGTRTSDLAQIYNGNVKILGTFRLKNISRQSPKTSITLNEQRVPPQILMSYWTLLGKQEIFVSNFVVQNTQLTTGAIYTNLLSQRPVTNFLSSSLNSTNDNIRVRFEEAHVEGSIDGFKNNIPSLIFYSAKGCVPLRGSSVNIESSVVFQGLQLFVRRLSAEHNRHSSWRSFVQKQSPVVHFKTRCHVRKIESAGFIVEKAMTASKFNNLKLRDQLSSAISISSNIDLALLKIQTFECKTLSIKFFETHVFEVFFKNIMWQLQNGKENLVSSVRLMTTEFKKDASSTTLNGNHNLASLIETLAFKNDVELSCGGNFIFAKGLTVKRSLEAQLMNGFVASGFMENSFSRFERQKLASPCTCEMIETEKLNVKMYNDIAWSQLIDKALTSMSLKVNLKAAEVFTTHLDSKYSFLNVVKFTDALKYPKCSTMQLVRARQGITAIHSNTTHLKRIVKFAVTKVGGPQIITGKLYSDDTRTKVKNLVKPDAIFFATSKFINFHEIFASSLKTEFEGTQKVSGITTLMSPIYIRNAIVKPVAFYLSKEINNVNVYALNNSIARPQSRISTLKKLSKLKGKLLILQNGPDVVHPNVLVPEVSFDKLETSFLSTYTINNYSLSYFLKNSMQLNSNVEQEVNTLLRITSVTLLPDSALSSINSVFVSDAVFSGDDQLQEIKGHKILNGKLTLQGPSTIKVINNIDFTDFLKNRILRSKDLSKKNLVVSRVNLPSGTSALKLSELNGRKKENFLIPGSEVCKAQTLLPLLQNTRERVSDVSYTKRSKRILFIDNNKSIQFSRNDSNKVSCHKNSIQVSPSKFNEVDISFHSGESVFDLSSLRIISTPNGVCGADKGENKLNIEWFNRTTSETKFQSSIALPGILNDVEIVETKNQSVVMIATVNNKEGFFVLVYQLDLSCNEWQKTQPDLRLSRVSTSRFVETADHQFLAISSTDEASEKNLVTIFTLNQTTNSLEPYQTINGLKVDIMLSIRVQRDFSAGEPKIFLIFAERNSKIVYIYQLSKHSKEFLFHQKLYFESSIAHIEVIDIADFSQFIVSLQSGQFCLFQFRGIESWKSKQCGQFPKVDVIRSYEYFKTQHLLLMSEKLNSATALSVYRQGL